jgi:hypothetical protein
VCEQKSENKKLTTKKEESNARAEPAKGLCGWKCANFRFLFLVVL